MKIQFEDIICYVRGLPVRLQRITDDPFANWCVQYAGNGHYFKTAGEAAAFMKGRRWVSSFWDYSKYEN